MSETSANFDPEYTIPSVSEADGEVGNYAELREEFGIFPDEDGSRYYDLKLLGMGGMGAVFSGGDPTLEREVAVKILREPFRNNREQIAKFINEARITARIDHPNVVSVHQLGVNEHHGVYFSMRRISGETLQTALRKLRDNDPEARKQYTAERMLDIFIAACNAVAAAHGKRILHCDLKPANIMIGSFGEVYVLDWGLARDFDSVSENKKVLSGTPAYMAPELVTGSVAEPDVLTDVYALGTILFSILTLNPAPFDMKLEKNELLERVARGKYLPLHASKGMILPRELAAICRKAMNNDRNARYQSVTDLLNDIYNYRSRRPVQAYSPSVFYRFFKLCRRHPAIPAAVIVAAVTLLLYVMAENIIAFTQDRSLIRSSVININIADNYYHKVLAMNRTNYADSDSGDPLIRQVIKEHNLQLQINTALMEYFSILDSISGMSPSGMEEFAALHAPQVMRHILELAIIDGDRDKLADILERCRRSEAFAAACRRDPELTNLVRQIEENCGIVTLTAPGSRPRHAVLTMPDQSTRELEIDGSLQLRLVSGRYRISTRDNVTMYWDILPGSRHNFTLEENPAGDFQMIPEDHFELKLSDSGKVRCPLPSFTIARHPAAGEYSWDEAQKFIAQNNSLRLPGVLELLKAWSSDDGKPLYTPSPANGKVWLNNGMLFDVAGKYVEKPLPGQKGSVFPVRMIGNQDD